MTAQPNPVEIIRAKRDARRLDANDISWFVEQYANGTAVSDAQAAAMAMAIFFNGLDDAELLAWTEAMIASGSRLDLGAVTEPTVDKHSTGGVGDKISLVVVPLVVACGAVVPQLSGRGLGHTGGTLDKLESIPGWRANLTDAEIIAQLRDVGGVIAGASDELAPADRKLYALRDVTATVESMPLIASSILSKKIAEGTGALLLDVKTGSGAFMSDHDRALDLARTMVDLGTSYGLATRALVTSMDDLLGRSAGNALEVAESIEVLAGAGPDDVIELSLAVATEMLDLAGVEADPVGVLASGEPLEVFKRMVRSQGGDLEVGLPSAPEQAIVEASKAGYVTAIEARPVGIAAWHLGAGRTAQGQPVSPVAGVRSLVTIGDRVDAGEGLLELHAERADRIAYARAAAESAVVIGDEPATRGRLVLDRVTPGETASVG